jgi:enoyl-CoA hydratase/carnithine racemase
VTLAIFRCRKITIAAVNGHAAGVGITGLQLPSDFRFIWARAKLAFPFIRRGIAPEGTLQSHACPSSSLPLLVLACGTRTDENNGA